MVYFMSKTLMSKHKVAIYVDTFEQRINVVKEKL